MSSNRNPDLSTIQPFAVIYHSNNLGYTESSSFSNMDGMFSGISDIPEKKQKNPGLSSILNGKGNENKPNQPMSKAETTKACAALLARIKDVVAKQKLALANGDNSTVVQLNVVYQNLYQRYLQLCPKKDYGKKVSKYSNAYGAGLVDMVIRDPETGKLITETTVAAQSNEEEKKSVYDWVSLGLTSAASIFGKKPATTTTGTNVFVQADTKPKGISPVTIVGIVLGVAALGVAGYYVFKK